MLNDMLLRAWVNLDTNRFLIQDKAQSALSRRDGAEVVQVMMIMGFVMIIIAALNLLLNPSITALGGRVTRALARINP